MEWIIIAAYILGAFLTHLFIYRDGEKGIEHSSANIACVAWPVTLLLYILLTVERWIKILLNNRF